MSSSPMADFQDFVESTGPAYISIEMGGISEAQMRALDRVRTIDRACSYCGAHAVDRKHRCVECGAGR